PSAGGRSPASPPLCGEAISSLIAVMTRRLLVCLGRVGLQLRLNTLDVTRVLHQAPQGLPLTLTRRATERGRRLVGHVIPSRVPSRLHLRDQLLGQRV